MNTVVRSVPFLNAPLFGHGRKEHIFWVLQVFSALYQQQPQILTNAIWAEMHFH